ncbi:MAG: MotE family protein [Nitrospinales bacterium]
MTRYINLKPVFAFSVLMLGVLGFALLSGQGGPLVFAQTPVENASQGKGTTEPRNLKARPRSVNLETLRMMETIERKTKDLKRREAELQAKEQQLRELEKKVREDLRKIELALTKSQELLGISENLKAENLNSLVKIYSSMGPAAAAALVSQLDERIAVQIISKMKSKIAGQVLSQLDTKVAKKISEKIVGKLPSKSKPEER